MLIKGGIVFVEMPHSVVQKQMKSVAESFKRLLDLAWCARLPDSIGKHNSLVFVLFDPRDHLLADGNRVSAFSVASTAIAAAQWSSTQVGAFLCRCNVT